MTMDLKSMTLEELRDLSVQIGAQPYLGRYIFSFIHSRGVASIEDITPVSKAFRAALMRDYHISHPLLVNRFDDPDGTVKLLFELPDGHRIESVILCDGDRKTLCVSTQSGCSRKCAFCATGYLKFGRNLTAGEIVDQVSQANLVIGRIGNIVYMGMGEPFDNYDETVRSARILNSPEGLNIGARHITLSTCGVISGIKRLANEGLGVRLAVSLHATDDKTRAMVMPGVRKEKLADLLTAVNDYQKHTRQRVTFEYIMIKGLNDSAQDARRLVRLIGPLKAHVNLIEFNPHPSSHFEPSERSDIRKFCDIVASGGIETVIRFRRGQTIKAACGQLGADWLEK